jgi:uncharacterized protein (DUF305 family)
VPSDPDPRATERAEAAVLADDAVPFRPDDEPVPTVPGATGDADDDLDGDDDGDVVVLSWYQRPITILALVLGLAVIGGMVGWLIADARHDDRGSDVDVGFLQDMRLHHEQAVGMAFAYLALDGTDPGLQQVARTIVVGQEIDIGRMIQMLRDMGAAEALESDTAMGWMGHEMPAAEMPGMATDAQLEQLATSSGAEADALFVQLMTAHHLGGIEMAEVAEQDASLAKVREFAASMVAGQQGDIHEMEQLLGS